MGFGGVGMKEAIVCRSCGAKQLQQVLDLGLQPLANNLLLPDDLGKAEPRFPLELLVCSQCWLMQIGDLVPPVKLFSEYLYFSSFSDLMLTHARTAAERYIADYGLNAGSRVVEIASNDGYLLKNFVKAGIPALGIEPAANVAKAAQAIGVETLVEFFGKNLAERLSGEGRSADLILGNNVFAHAPDTNDFVAGLARLVTPQGRIVLEFPYALDFLEKHEFDTVYHEHVFYFSLLPLIPLFERHGLAIYDVERISIHGGSLRLFAARAGVQTRRPSVNALLDEERRHGLDSMRPYHDFSSRVHVLRDQLLAQLRSLKSKGSRIAAYGASAKGSTLLNFFGIDGSLLEFVVDRSTYKQGRLTPGTHLPILPAEALVERMPDYTLLLTWNFSEEILRQQSEYRRRGGRFIIPIPEVAIV